MNNEHSDATEMNAQGLLRAAARLVERAMTKLNMEQVDCVTCSHALFQNLDHARIHLQFEETPKKLRTAADLLDVSVQADGHPAKTSRGYHPSVSELRRRQMPRTFAANEEKL